MFDVIRDDLFGPKTRSLRKKGKAKIKHAKKREKKIIRKLETERDKRYVRAAVAYGLAFKAEVRVRRARALAGGDSKGLFTRSDRMESLDGEFAYALQSRKAAYRRAKKILAEEGIELTLDRYGHVSVYCKASRL